MCVYTYYILVLQWACVRTLFTKHATVITNNTQDTKQYIGMTSNTFKERYRNHIKSFTHKKNIQTKRNFQNASGT